MLKLYTKNGCVPCNNVKEYLSGRPDLEVEVINCSDNPEAVMEFSSFSKTFPTLVTDWGFLANSEKILEHFATLNNEGNAKHTIPTDVKIDTFTQGYQPQTNQPSTPKNIDNKIARIPEPDCEACQ